MHSHYLKISRTIALYSFCFYCFSDISADTFYSLLMCKNGKMADVTIIVIFVKLGLAPDQNTVVPIQNRT